MHDMVRLSLTLLILLFNVTAFAATDCPVELGPEVKYYEGTATCTAQVQLCFTESQNPPPTGGVAVSKYFSETTDSQKRLTAERICTVGNTVVARYEGTCDANVPFKRSVPGQPIGRKCDPISYLMMSDQIVPLLNAAPTSVQSTKEYVLKRDVPTTELLAWGNPNGVASIEYLNSNSLAGWKHHSIYNVDQNSAYFDYNSLVPSGAYWFPEEVCPNGSIPRDPDARILFRLKANSFDLQYGSSYKYVDRSTRLYFGSKYQCRPQYLNLKVKGGISNTKTYLSSTNDGSLVDLWDIDDGSGRQVWYKSLSRDGTSYNIIVKDGTGGVRKYLSALPDGSKVYLHDKDDGSGLQRWVFSGDSISVKSGVSTNRIYLSVTADGTKVDLWHEVASDRQRWVSQPAIEPQFFSFQIKGGVSGARRYLSVPSSGLFADLWSSVGAYQTWLAVPSPDGYSYYIVLKGSLAGPRKYLSSNADGTKVDLWDTPGERQSWIFEGETIRVKGSVTGARKYLSVNADGTKVDLWHEATSDRQRWVKVPISN